MGRNITIDSNDAPVGGVIQTNYSKGSLWKNADGKEFYGLIANTNPLDLTNYPTFKTLVSNQITSNNSAGSQTLIGYYATGTPTFKTFSLAESNSTTNSSYWPSLAWASDLGAKPPMAASGNYAWVQGRYATQLYGYNGSNNSSWIIDTANRNILSVLTPYTVVTWYDTSTSKYRSLGYEGNGSTIYNYNSSDGTTITASSVTGWPSGGWSAWNDSSYTATLAYAKDSLVVIVAYVSGSPYKMYVSTNSGTTFTDRSTAYSGVANFSMGIPNLFNYDGTTLFLATNGTVIMRYSTNSGTTWSNSTVSGVTSSTAYPYSSTTSAIGATSSQLMFVDSAGSKIYYSSNGGQSWTTYNAPQVDASLKLSGNTQYSSLVYMGGTWYLGIAGYNGANNVNFVSKSSDNGATWTTSTLITPSSAGNYGQGYSMLFTFNSVLYFAIAQGIWKSTDGTTWTQIWNGPVSFSQNGMLAFELTSYIQIGSIVINKSTFACTQTTDPVIYASNGGYMYTFNVASDYAAMVGATSNVGGMTYAKTSSSINTYGTWQAPYQASLGSGNYSFANVYEYMRIK